MPFTLDHYHCPSCSKNHVLYCGEADVISTTRYQYTCPETREEYVFVPDLSKWSKTVSGHPSGSVEIKRAR
jgi:hypothetical protein